MISQNELYDISVALTAIRNNIKEDVNKEVLYKIISVLNSKSETFKDNQIRRAIASINNLDQERWYYVYHNNVYANYKILRNKYIYKLLIKLCYELKCLVESNNFEKAYDLADCFHCLPNIIADNNFTIPKYFWKIYVKPYRDKWDKSFLVTDQKFLTTIRGRFSD